MPRHISLLFPGQGSQSLGMLSSFERQDLDFISEVSNEALSFDLIDIIQNGPEDKLNQTSFTQPALLATSYLYYKNIMVKTRKYRRGANFIKKQKIKEFRKRKQKTVIKKLSKKLCNYVLKSFYNFIFKQLADVGCVTFYNST